MTKTGFLIFQGVPQRDQADNPPCLLKNASWKALSRCTTSCISSSGGKNVVLKCRVPAFWPKPLPAKQHSGGQPAGIVTWTVVIDCSAAAHQTHVVMSEAFVFAKTTACY
jgi:hypothetical protein